MAGVRVLQPSPRAGGGVGVGSPEPGGPARRTRVVEDQCAKSRVEDDERLRQRATHGDVEGGALQRRAHHAAHDHPVLAGHATLTGAHRAGAPPGARCVDQQLARQPEVRVHLRQAQQRRRALGPDHAVGADPIDRRHRTRAQRRQRVGPGRAGDHHVAVPDPHQQPRPYARAQLRLRDAARQHAGHAHRADAVTLPQQLCGAAGTIAAGHPPSLLRRAAPRPGPSTGRARLSPKAKPSLPAPDPPRTATVSPRSPTWLRSYA